jgi:hypothetical protein
MGLRGEVGVQADEVRLAQQLVHLDARGAQLGLLLRRCGVHVVVQDAHPETAATPRHLATDAPEAHDAQGGSVNVDAHQQHRPPGLPVAVSDVVHRLRDPAGGGHEQREGQVRRRLGQDPRRVAGGHPTAGERGNVDVVEADGEVAHHLQLRPGGVQQLVVDTIGEERQQAVDAGHAPEQLVAWRRQLVLPQVDLAGVADRVESLVWDHAGDEDARPVGAHHADPASSPVRSSFESDSPTRSSAASRFSREFA